MRGVADSPSEDALISDLSHERATGRHRRQYLERLLLCSEPRFRVEASVPSPKSGKHSCISLLSRWSMRLGGQSALDKPHNWSLAIVARLRLGALLKTITMNTPGSHFEVIVKWHICTKTQAERLKPQVSCHTPNAARL